MAVIFQYDNSITPGNYISVDFNTSTKVITVLDEIGSIGVVEPEVGEYIYSACDGTTQDRVIYNGGNNFSYEPEENSIACGYVAQLESSILNVTPSRTTVDEGTALLQTIGGVSPYEYSKDNTIWNTSSTVTGLAAGSNTIWVRDSELTTISLEAIIPVLYESTKEYTATCGNNYNGSSTSTKTATSLLSQLDADNKALNLATSEANNNLVCVLDITFSDIVEPYVEYNLYSLSYTPELKSFTSYHTYSPHIIIGNGDRIFLGDNNKFEELNKGNEGVYFGVQYASILYVISNDNPLITKSMDNIVIQSDECLSSLYILSDNKVSSLRNLMVINDFDYEIDNDELLVKYKNNQYQLALPRATDESRFKNKWVEMQWSYDNNSPINLKYITMLYRPVAR